MAKDAAAKKTSKNLVGLVVCMAAVAAAPLLGVAVTGILLGSAFRGVDHVDPSQKAQMLGEGISAAMNGAAGGMVVSFLCLVPAVVLAVRLFRERKAPRE